MSSNILIKKGSSNSQKAAALFIAVIEILQVFLWFFIYSQLKDHFFLSDAQKMLRSISPILGVFSLVLGVIWVLRFAAYSAQTICVSSDCISGTGLKTPPFSSESFTVLPADVVGISVKSKVLMIETKSKTVKCLVADADQVADTIRKLCNC